MTLQHCFLCGSNDLRIVRVPTELRQGERRAFVEAEHYECSSCGEQVVTPAQMRSAQTALVDEFRRRENLLSPAAIKALRSKHSLTQAMLEQVLGVAPKTVVRWERGTVCQSRAIDQLLRVADAVPGAMEFLAQRGKVDMPLSRPRENCSILPFPPPRVMQRIDLDPSPEMPNIPEGAMK